MQKVVSCFTNTCAIIYALFLWFVLGAFPEKRYDVVYWSGFIAGWALIVIVVAFWLDNIKQKEK